MNEEKIRNIIGRMVKNAKRSSEIQLIDDEPIEILLKLFDDLDSIRWIKRMTPQHFPHFSRFAREFLQLLTQERDMLDEDRLYDGSVLTRTHHHRLLSMMSHFVPPKQADSRPQFVIAAAGGHMAPSMDTFLTDEDGPHTVILRYIHGLAQRHVSLDDGPLSFFKYRGQLLSRLASEGEEVAYVVHPDPDDLDQRVGLIDVPVLYQCLPQGIPAQYALSELLSDGADSQLFYESPIGDRVYRRQLLDHLERHVGFPHHYVSAIASSFGFVLDPLDDLRIRGFDEGGAVRFPLVAREEI